jgi:hypothetical protein
MLDVVVSCPNEPGTHIMVGEDQPITRRSTWPCRRWVWLLVQKCDECQDYE